MEKEWKQMLHLIRDCIIRKLDSARRFINIDKGISAGLHTFALEEFGKILLLERSKRVANNTKRKGCWSLFQIIPLPRKKAI